MKAPLRPEPDWHGKTVTVMGLGLFGGGLGAAAFALRKGATVTVTDQRDRETLSEAIDALKLLPGAESVRLVLGEHREEDFTGADMVLVNPAVPPRARFAQLAHKSGARVTTAIELLLGGLSCRVVAVTGTHGKSSTVHFTAALLRAGLGPSVRVAMGGNIGGSLLAEIESLGPHDVVVLELSSYQLEHLGQSFLDMAAKTRAVDVAAITTLGIDHLARHGTVESYHAAKRRIEGLTGQLGPNPGTVIVPHDVVDAFPGAQRLVPHGGASGPAPGTEGLRVPGGFQRENLALAFAIGEALGADRSAMERAVPDLTGLPHRMEHLTEFSVARSGRPLVVHDNGVSTTPESTVAALESLGSPDGVRVVLVGGQAKRGCDMEALGAVAASLGWLILPFGAAGDEIALAAREAGARLLNAQGGQTGQDRDEWPGDVAEAVQGSLAPLVTPPFEVPPAGAPKGVETPLHVLFSPACASFDRYPNFRARALAFREAMLGLTCPPDRESSSRSVGPSEREQSKD